MKTKLTKQCNKQMYNVIYVFYLQLLNGDEEKRTLRKHKPHKRLRCEMCAACKSTGCGECIFCKDKKVNGGPGLRTGDCVKRECEVSTSKKTLFVSLSCDRIYILFPISYFVHYKCKVKSCFKILDEYYVSNILLSNR